MNEGRNKRLSLNTEEREKYLKLAVILTQPNASSMQKMKAISAKPREIPNSRSCYHWLLMRKPKLIKGRLSSNLLAKTIHARVAVNIPME